VSGLLAARAAVLSMPAHWELRAMLSRGAVPGLCDSAHSTHLLCPSWRIQRADKRRCEHSGSQLASRQLWPSVWAPQSP
jgi:hypothetical protein